MWCLKSSLHDSIVIPGNPRESGGRSGIQENQILLDARFRGYNGGETTDFFCELLGVDTSWVTPCG